MKSIRTNVDIRRLANAVSYPGIDPRIWCSWAVVNQLGFDSKQGIFADVTLVPSGEPETVYIGASYAGGSFGEWEGVSKDDTVLLLFPNGDPNQGGVLVSRTWNGGDLPPAEVQDVLDSTSPTTDRVTVVRPGSDWRVYTSQGGTIKMGDAQARNLAHSDEVQTALQAISVQLTALNAWLAAVVTPAGLFLDPSKAATITLTTAVTKSIADVALAILTLPTTKLEGT